MHRCADLLMHNYYPKIRFSSVYKTAAQEVTDQDDFLNAVAVIETEQKPEEVHKVLQGIETGLRKDPPYQFGPRTIDLDILMYDDLKMETEELTIPHPRMMNRRFVLEPLFELTPDPAIQEALQKTLDQTCEKTTITLP